MHYAITQPGNLVPGGADHFLRFDAGLAGIAIAITITRSPVVRLAGAEILGIGGLAVASLHKAVRERHRLAVVVYESALLAPTSRAVLAAARYPTTLVAIDQTASARMPGRKP